MTVLEPGQVAIPSLHNSHSTSSTSLAQTVLDRIYNPLLRTYAELFPGCPPSREDVFEDGLEMRITRMKVVEVREGAEVILAKDHEISNTPSKHPIHELTSLVHECER